MGGWRMLMQTSSNSSSSSNCNNFNNSNNNNLRRFWVSNSRMPIRSWAARYGNPVAARQVVRSLELDPIPLCASRAAKRGDGVC